MGTLKNALTAIFNANGDSALTSSMKIPFFNASNVPYGLSSMSALASVLGAATKTIQSGTDLNTITTAGIYISINSSLSATIVNCPISEIGFILIVLKNSTNTTQLLLGNGSGGIYARGTTSGSWDNSKWYEIQKTAVQ